MAKPIGLSAADLHTLANLKPETGAVLVLMPGTATEHVIPMPDMDRCNRAVAHTSGAVCMDARAADAYFTAGAPSDFTTAAGR